RAILHLDMDAFFVNVYLLSHPEDKGIPLAIGGRPEQRGVVASASYEARAFGICSAMPMKTAVRLYRDLKIVSADWDAIRSSSHKVMEILRDVGRTEQISVDEAFVDLSDVDAPANMAIALQARVKQATGLPCSVGLGTSKLVAKVASDYDKPEGCTIVASGDEADFLAPLPVRVIWGIGQVTAERLQEVGVTTCAELVALPLDRLQANFGNQAESMQRRARGQDDREVNDQPGISKSISQEWTFTRDIGDEEQLATKLADMCEQVGASLQRKQLVARTVTVKFRWADFTTLTRQRSIIRPISTPDAIFSLAHDIWRANWPTGKPMRLLGVGVSNIESAEALRQLMFNFSEE
ncbi:MAG: DNA polymerase IV, partial [Candidatus Promineifilaceae bacterium]